MKNCKKIPHQKGCQPARTISTLTTKLYTKDHYKNRNTLDSRSYQKVIVNSMGDFEPTTYTLLNADITSGMSKHANG